MADLADPGITLVADSPRNLRMLAEIAEFWKIPYSTQRVPTQDKLVFSSGQIREESGRGDRQIICPSSPDDGRMIAAKHGLRLALRQVTLSVPVAKTARASVNTLIYEFAGSNIETVLSSNGVGVLFRIRDTETYFLSVDITSEYYARLHTGLNDPPSLRFRHATRLPFSYNTIPSFVRNRSFKSALTAGDITGEKLGPVECLRTLFLASLSMVARQPIPKLWFWNRGKTHAVVVSHDVETEHGLKSGAPRLLEIEARLGVHSTWNVPSARYALSSEDLRPLAKAGEVGGHDTVHDGRLGLLDPGKMEDRLRACRTGLEEKAGVKVPGFRAPLLQHSRDLLAAACKAGFTFDSSVPSWEPLSPTSFRAHGVGTLFPFEVYGIVEIPVTLPQDHQLVRAMSLSPTAAVKRWQEISNWIKGIGGACVLLVHPDYEFALPRYAEEYEKLLKGLMEPDCAHMTMSQMAEWWTQRSRTKIEFVEEGIALRTTDVNEVSNELEVQLVTGYGKDGFVVEALN